MDIINRLPKLAMRTIAITGGKGGIGKTTVAINLAIAFAKQNKKVLLFDADLGLANVDVLLGIKIKRNISDVIAGKCSLDEVCIEGPHGIKIIPASSGIQSLAELNTRECYNLIKAFSSMADEFHIMLIDTAAGISTKVIDFVHASQDIVIVLCNDPASLTDSYALIKVLYKKYNRHSFGVIVNKTESYQESCDVFTHFQEASQQFINVDMHYLGMIPNDEFIKIAALERVAIVDKFAESRAAREFNTICRNIQQWGDAIHLEGGIQFFFERLILSQPIF